MFQISSPRMRVALVVFAAALVTSACTSIRFAADGYVYVPESQGAVIGSAGVIGIGNSTVTSGADLILAPDAAVVAVPTGSTSIVGDPGCNFVSLGGDPPGGLECMAQVGSIDGEPWIAVFTGPTVDHRIIDVDAARSRLLTVHGIVLTWTGPEPLVEFPWGGTEALGNIDLNDGPCTWFPVVDPATALVATARCGLEG